MINPSTSEQDRDEASAAFFILGFPPTALGAWLVWNLRHSSQQSSQAKIQQREQLFLELLQNHGGKLTVLQFAALAKLPVDEAKLFLDQKANALNATFDVSDTGAVVYQFPV
ncbi:MAG: hypothetical protein WBA99_19390 [Nodosilinea sp.]